MSFGSVISERAISSRRRSPPETRLALVLRMRRQAELVEQLVLPIPALPAAHRAGLEDGHQVVFDRELLEDARILREVAHARLGTLVHGQARDVPAVEDDLAAVGVDQADRHAEAGGLARPVGAEQADDLALARPRSRPR